MQLSGAITPANGTERKTQVANNARLGLR
jgi:hypothetical protein